MDAARSSRPICPDPTQGAPLNSKPKTQKTKPKQGKPIEIPVPKRSAFDKLLGRAATNPPKLTGKSK